MCAVAAAGDAVKFLREVRSWAERVAIRGSWAERVVAIRLDGTSWVFLWLSRDSEVG